MGSLASILELVKVQLFLNQKTRHVFVWMLMLSLFESTTGAFHTLILWVKNHINEYVKKQFQPEQQRNHTIDNEDSEEQPEEEQEQEQEEFPDSKELIEKQNPSMEQFSQSNLIKVELFRTQLVPLISQEDGQLIAESTVEYIKNLPNFSEISQSSQPQPPPPPEPLIPPSKNRLFLR